jgi:hypothetical protein
MWGVVLSMQKHNGKIGSQGQSLFIKLSAVNAILCITSQAKNLIFGSELDFQMTGAGKVTITPIN